MSNDRLSLCFPLRRQASLNEAAERYYGQAASLRPNVSTTIDGLITHITVYPDVQSQSVCPGPRAASSQRPPLSVDLWI